MPSACMAVERAPSVAAMPEATNAGMRGKLSEFESMRRHCSWRAGGSVRRLFVPQDRGDLQAWLAQHPLEAALYVIGLGSNLLVRDGGLDASVVLTHGALSGIGLETVGSETLVNAEAGVAAPKVARFAARHGLEGAEFLAGIPGTVGGALAMNAGCYGSDTWSHVVDVTTVDRAGQLRVRTPAEFSVGYRHVAASAAQSESPAAAASAEPAAGRLAPLPEWFVSARLRFTPGDAARASRRIRDYLLRRIASQPLQQPNAGSVFRNPPGDHAARLIESCGLKGRTRGAAQVSPRHANFIVNLGTATAADIEGLILEVREEVRGRTGVLLETEVRIVGCPP